MSVIVELGDNQSERMTADDIIIGTRQVVKGLEALRSENKSIHQRLQEALLRERKLQNEREEAVAAAVVADAESVDVQALELLEEKHDLVCKSLEGIELGIAEAQVREKRAAVSPAVGGTVICGHWLCCCDITEGQQGSLRRWEDGTHWGENG